MTITFQTRSGDLISGLVYEDYGHALMIEVTAANRKNLRGRKMLFAKNDMLAIGPVTVSAAANSVA